MSRNYKPIPPYINSWVTLSDEHPSGLAWVKEDRHKKPGAPVTRRSGKTNFYTVAVNGNTYLAHRVVYYLRTGQDPGVGDVIHGPDNPDCDNRKPLTISDHFKRKRIKRHATYEDIRNRLPYVPEDSLKEFVGQLALLGGSVTNATLRNALGWDEQFYEDAKTILLSRFLIMTRRAPGGAIALSTPTSYLGPQYLQHIAEPFFSDFS